MMKKSHLAVALTSLLVVSGTSYAGNEKSQTGLNGVEIELTGSFYHPNENQVLQETAPVIEFDGLTSKGGKQIVEGYKQIFGKDVMGETIKAKLAELDEIYTSEELVSILATSNTLQESFPELIAFYTGMGEASGYPFRDVYLAAWASDGLFAKSVQSLAAMGLSELKQQSDKMRGCTVIGWNNGVIGQNQDMPISFGGYGTIWKSDRVIVHAAEPLFNAMAMGRDLATVANTVDLFHKGAVERGAPVSGLSMAMVAKYDDVNDAKKTLDKIEVNAAYSTSFSDKKGQVLAVENQLGNNIVIDGSVKGYVTHTNHPLGQEQALVDHYANGQEQLFDYAMKTTLWRNVAAESHAKFSPTRDVDALKEAFKQKPILKAPYQGNGFVTTNSVIHDLNEGCSYGTTWLPSVQEYTKVCFDN
ncbi:hypothetical protein A3K86_20835 [Photobacterium jeanii]|uniref:Acyl-coenzyme A:6-aminopenicillanic acid acyl-transferase n=1 Tax=Photobacterium jeanii TaxID=858640 RepID=A0A178K3R6_9GAMM|nr:hypothetical protein [Photobacterium jeanii]OAN11394.1 hypothetical protein A3K86_20835 [Photobacterium jeanii]PST90915.1 hypothetical protein C9I91_09940 [Photobacterium jeanii]